MAPFDLRRRPADPGVERIIRDASAPADEDKTTRRIRCPHCAWEPDAQSRWSCVRTGPPEYFDGGCGTAWNTFDTGGRCPGCAHAWRHTACLRCSQWSLHADWYEDDEAVR